MATNRLGRRLVAAVACVAVLLTGCSGAGGGAVVAGEPRAGARSRSTS